MFPARYNNIDLQPIRPGVMRLELFGGRCADATAAKSR
jgi:hypothetical protein